MAAYAYSLSLLLKFSNELVNLNLVKKKKYRGPAAKLKGDHRFLQGVQGFFYRSHYFKITL